MTQPAILYSADVSYFQRKVDSSYSRQWLIIRCCDGSFLDPNAIFNADWCRGALSQGDVVGWTAYVVYRPGQNNAVLANLAQIVPLDRVMIDVESWQGSIRGDHSDEINALADGIAAAVGQDNVWAYGNKSDLASIYPRRYPWLKIVVSAWGPNRPTGVANMVGWQYTEGQTPSGSRPLSSSPFGACDHNEIYLDLVGPSGGGTPIPAPIEEDEDDMQGLYTVLYQGTPQQESWLIMGGDRIRIVSSTDDQNAVVCTQPGPNGQAAVWKSYSMTPAQVYAFPDVTDYSHPTVAQSLTALDQAMAAPTSDSPTETEGS